MKKLNLNESGTKAFAWAMALLAAAALLYFASRFFTPPFRTLFTASALISMAAGLAVLLVLLVLVGIELWQDDKLFRRYEASKSVRIPLSGGGFECQHCGNRKVGKDEKHCRICGKPLAG